MAYSRTVARGWSLMNNLDWKIVAELHATPNITRTAERLNMTQSALSKRLQQIEDELGAQIVVRFCKGVILTPEGEYLATKAREFLTGYEEMRRTLLKVGNGQSGLIRIGATNSFVRSILPPHLKKYQRQFPNVEIDITSDTSANLITKLKDFSFHVAFIWGEMDGDFERVLLNTNQARAVSCTPITLADLPKMPQVVYQKDSFARKLMDTWWRDNFDEPPHIGMHANHGDTCREMVLAGLGYAIFLSNAFLPENCGLFELPLTYADGTPVVRNSWMVWQKDISRIPLVRNFVEFMRSHLSEPAPSRTGLATRVNLPVTG